MQVYGAGNVGSVDVSSMDIETALLLVQHHRSELLSDGLREQLERVSAKNQQIAAKNGAISDMKVESANLHKGIDADQQKIAELQQMQSQLQQVHDRDPEHWTGLGWGWANDGKQASHDMLDKVRAEGLTDKGAAPRDIDGNGTMDASGTTIKGWMDQLDEKIAALEEGIQTKQETIQNNDNAIRETQNEIDSLSNSQQMEMLRLQSLSNKRNEAFDVMTNFVKKMQDSRSSIISNMR